MDHLDVRIVAGESRQGGLVERVRAEAATKNEHHRSLRVQREPAQPSFARGFQQGRTQRSSGMDELGPATLGVRIGEADPVHQHAEDTVRPSHVRIHLHRHGGDAAHGRFGDDGPRRVGAHPHHAVRPRSTQKTPGVVAGHGDRTQGAQSGQAELPGEAADTHHRERVARTGDELALHAPAAPAEGHIVSPGREDISQC